jgi:hypothetical protein
MRLQNMVEGYQLGVEGGLRWGTAVIQDGSGTLKSTELTFLHSLVRFLAFAIATPSFTNTQPTGTSLAARASSA